MCLAIKMSKKNWGVTVLIYKLQAFWEIEQINMNIVKKWHFLHIKSNKKITTINIFFKFRLLVDNNLIFINNKKKRYVAVLLKKLQLIVCIIWHIWKSPNPNADHALWLLHECNWLLHDFNYTCWHYSIWIQINALVKSWLNVENSANH